MGCEFQHNASFARGRESSKQSLPMQDKVLGTEEARKIHEYVRFERPPTPSRAQGHYSVVHSLSNNRSEPPIRTDRLPDCVLPIRFLPLSLTKTILAGVLYGLGLRLSS